MICTCSHESVLAYPAAVVVEYLMPIMASSEGVRRVSEGVKTVGKLMTDRVKVKCNVTVEAIAIQSDTTLVCGMFQHVGSTSQVLICLGLPCHQTVRDSRGEHDTFDRVIVCTQANDAQRLLAACDPELSELLARIQHERSDTVVHTDAALMPADKANWCVGRGAPSAVLPCSHYGHV